MAQKPTDARLSAGSVTAIPSRSHGQPPLNQGIRYATADAGHDSGAVDGSAMNARALVKLRSCAPMLSASIFRRLRPRPGCCWYSTGQFDAAVELASDTILILHRVRK